MNGRIESSLKTKERIFRQLNDLPDYVSDYYYFFSANHEPKCCEEYLHKIKRFLEFYKTMYGYENLKDVDLSNINVLDLTKYFENIKYKKVNKNGKETIEQTSASYWKQNHTILNSFFSFLTSNKITLFNPMEKIPRIRRVDEIDRVHLTKDDFKQIIDNLNDTQGLNMTELRWRDRDKAIMLLLMNTGIRETALIEINKEDIDFKNRTITIVDKRNKKHKYPINSTLLKALLDWGIHRNAFCSDKEKDAFFISAKKKRLSVKALQNIVEKYTQSTGKKISPHKIRGGVCTILYEETHDIEFVRDFIGHTDSSTTQRYIVKDGSVKEKGANMLGSIFDN